MAADDDAWMGSPSARDPAFRLIVGPRDEPAFEVYAADAPERDEWQPLYLYWRRLPSHPNLLEEVGTGEAAVLRFAAIDWKWQPLPFGALVAAVGDSLVGVFELLVACLDSEDLRWFTSPFVALDIFGRPRVGFWPPTRSAQHAGRVAPEVVAEWSAAGETALVYAVGQLLLQVTTLCREDIATPVGAIIRRCLMTQPHQRYQKLKHLRAALRSTAEGRAYRDWQASEHVVEEGLGYLLLQRWQDALDVFDRIQPVPKLVHAAFARGRLEAAAHGAQSRPKVRPVSEVTRRTRAPWADVAVGGAYLESQRDWHAALSLYRYVADDVAHRIPQNLALARCFLALGDHGYAIDHARRVLAIDPASHEALQLLAKAQLARRDYAAALDTIASWERYALAAAPVQYARGKALLGLGRYAEARDAFDRALETRPSMIEAMLLRREADRHLRLHREAVGAQREPSLPAELSALIGGEPGAAIEALHGERFAADPVAQLVLAQLLAAEQRYSEALEVFVACTEHGDVKARALCGAAAALLELDRAQEALDLLGNAPELEAFELRVRALRQLGRTADADVEQTRFDARLGALSAARVRAARGGV